MKLKRASFVLSTLFFLGVGELGLYELASADIQKSQKSKIVQNSGKKILIEKEQVFDGVYDSSQINYLPYVQVGGSRFFDDSDFSKWATAVDLFLPLFQEAPYCLFFTQVRFYDRTGSPFEGNIHLGYRNLSDDGTRLLGFYGSFDRKRSNYENYFNQLTFGVEHWFDQFFIGANYYQPIGLKMKPIGYSSNTIETEEAGNNFSYSNLYHARNLLGEVAASGGDLQIGYELTKGLTAYVGGYYFRTPSYDMRNIAGPKAKITYDFSLDKGQRILGMFNKIGVEAGIQHDKPRGTAGYVSLNLRVGVTPTTANLEGVSRHMVDLIHRDVDIVSVKGVVNKDKLAIKDRDGKPIKLVKLGNINAEKSDILKRDLADTSSVYVLQGDLNEIKTPIAGLFYDHEASNIIHGSEVSANSPLTGQDLSPELRGTLSPQSVHLQEIKDKFITDAAQARRTSADRAVDFLLDNT
jgi:hypothetical protein